MKREDLQSYIDKWQLVQRLEDEELKNAPLELNILQMFSIWEIAESLNFQQPPEPPDRTWQTLQQKWLDTHG